MKPIIASDAGKTLPDGGGVGVDVGNIIRELNRAKCAFQLRTIELILKGGVK